MNRSIQLLLLFTCLVGFNSLNAEDTASVVIEAKESTLNFDEKLFENVSGKGTEAGAGVKVTWNISYDKVNNPALGELVIRYKRKVDKKKPWIFTEKFSKSNTKFEIKDLIEAEKYVFQIGTAQVGFNLAGISEEEMQLKKSDNLAWSKKGKFKTERSWGIMKLLILIGALGLFIYGMKLMSEGLQQAAGSKLRKMLSSITSNRVSGVLTGFGITSIVQSSSVTTVMTVSLVNAGLLTLVQSAGVMMGANIGTTITAWLINFFGFKVSLSAYAYVIIAIGAPLLFFTKSKIKAWASAIIGFALLFMGLGALKGAVPGLGADSEVVQFFVNYKDAGYLGILMFVGLGTLATIVIQSSSAAMALTMTLVAGGIIPFEVAAAMILGENIGTTITAELASLIGNVHAKRSARIHSMFNLIGVTWAVLLFPFLLDGIKNFMEWKGWGNPFVDYKEASNTGLAIFHTTFNALNVFILIWFVPQLVKLAERTVKSRGEEDEQYRLEYIEGAVGLSPEFSILEAKKELVKFGTLTKKMSGYLQDLIIEKDAKAKDKLVKKIAKYEDISDKIEVEVTQYLIGMSQAEHSPELSARMMGMLSIANDLERVSDIIYQMSKNLERKNDEKIWFSEKHRENIASMFVLVDEAFEIMIENVGADYGFANLEKAVNKEKEINQFRNQLRKEYLKKIDVAENIQSELIYHDMFSSAEKLGDHIINVSEAVEGDL
jgi:phosphate:Na+ symporter